MDFKFNKDSQERPNAAGPGNKGNQNILLVVLLVLVAGFAYIYFFTGLIKPLPEQKPVEMPAPQAIKNPIPARDGDVVKGTAPAAVTNAKPEVAAAPVVKPEPPKVAQATQTPTAQKEAVQSKELPKKPESVPAAVKKPVPVAAQKQEKQEKQEQKQTAVVDKKQAPAEKKQPKKAEQNVAAAAAKPEKAAKAKLAKKPAPVAKEAKKSTDAIQGSGDHFTIVVGSYLLEGALAPDLAAIRKAGLDAAVTTGARKKATMNRLLLGEYKDRSAAQAELEKLKKYTSDAFIMDHAGKPAVYAGSYLLDERAASEKERLSAAGFPLTLKKAEVAVPTKKLTAGSFTSRKAAEEALKKLKDAGLKAAHVSAQ